MTQNRRTAYLLFRRKMPFGASRRWSRCRPKADIGASVDSAIYLRDQGSCLTDNFGSEEDISAVPGEYLGCAINGHKNDLALTQAARPFEDRRDSVPFRPRPDRVRKLALGGSKR